MGKVGKFAPVSCGETIWLGICCVMILCLVAIGGVTRLTNSGLSITEWKPVVGVIPPLDAKAWLKEKEKYEKTPEHKYITSGISLEDFKSIYLIEYFHRLFGRVLGVVFFVPLIYFISTKKLPRRRVLSYAVTSIVGLLQGAIGWFMVKSGLVDVPYVSHYRLAAHLFLAVLLFSLLWRSFLDSGGVRATKHVGTFGVISAYFTLIITYVQIVIGAMVAGLDAGLIYNTFPLMDGTFVPEQILSLDTWRSKPLSLGIVVQFMHRMVAILVVLSTAMTFYLVRNTAAIVVSVLVVLQFLLGVATLVNVVPLHLAVTHQIVGFCVVAAEIYLLKMIKLEKKHNTVHA